MTDQADLRKMVKELLADESDRLTTWECEFLDSVNRQDRLSDKQAAIIERVWNKIYGE